MNNVANHNKWVKQVGEYIGSEDTRDILLYCIAYTLQSLRSEEDMTRFRWE